MASKIAQKAALAPKGSQEVPRSPPGAPQEAPQEAFQEAPGSPEADPQDHEPQAH